MSKSSLDMKLICTKKALIEKLKQKSRDISTKSEGLARRSHKQLFTTGYIEGLETAISWLEIWEEKYETHK